MWHPKDMWMKETPNMMAMSPIFLVELVVVGMAHGIQGI